MANFLTYRYGIEGGVQKVSLEAIQWFDAQVHVVLLQHWPKFLVGINHSLPLIARAASTGKVSDGRIKGTRNQICSSFRGDLHAVRHMRYRLAPDLGIIAGQAHFLRQNRTYCTTQTVSCQRLP